MSETAPTSGSPEQGHEAMPNTHQSMSDEILREGADRIDAERFAEYARLLGEKRNTVHAKRLVPLVLAQVDAEIAAAIRATRNDTIGEAIAAVQWVPEYVGTTGGGTGVKFIDWINRRQAIAALTALRTPTEDAEALAVADSAGA